MMQNRMNMNPFVGMNRGNRGFAPQPVNVFPAPPQPYGQGGVRSGMMGQPRPYQPPVGGQMAKGMDYPDNGESSFPPIQNVNVKQ